MAGRLLVRCTRLFFSASSLAPAASVAPFVQVQRAQGWSSFVSVRQIHEKRQENKSTKNQFYHAQSKLDELLDKALVPEDVLLAWKKHGGNGNQAARTLVSWRVLKMKNKSKPGQEDLLDERLQDLIHSIRQQISTVWNKMLVPVLPTLWLMDFPSSDLTLNSVQAEILFRITKLTPKNLTSLVVHGVDRKDERDQLIVNNCVKQLELRWTEISDVKTICVLLSKGQHLPPMLMERLDNKALEVAEKFSVEEICKVCLSLAFIGRRSVPLLRGKLNFHQSQVFQRMASELLPRVPALRPVDVTRYAKSLGFLKWLNIPLFEAIAEHYIDKSHEYSTAQICNLIMTFSRLGFQTSKGEEFYKKVHAALEGCLFTLEPFLLTDVVWALCVLQQAKDHYILPLAQREHAAKLSEGTPVRVKTYHQKLLHIMTTLYLEHQGSSEPAASLLAMSVPSNPDSTILLSPLQISLRKVLLHLVGQRTEALRTGVQTVYGWTIEVEVVVDSENRPIDLSTLEAPYLLSGGGDQPLPAGAQRVAFLAWEYPNFCSKTHDLLGRFKMMKRHLQLAGFIIVEVPYYEWLELKTEGQTLAYLKGKIGKSIAEDMAK
ncbi:FAST kinase domain-containing protein 4 isoform 2-T4 [Aulostomus maculatus]